MTTAYGADLYARPMCTTRVMADPPTGNAMSAQDIAVDVAFRTDQAVAAHRNAGLDALRACLTLLVVFHHCAITYGALGGWYYHEVAAGPSVESALLTLFCAINQAFFMGLFFSWRATTRRTPSIAKARPASWPTGFSGWACRCWCMGS